MPLFPKDAIDISPRLPNQATCPGAIKAKDGVSETDKEDLANLSLVPLKTQKVQPRKTFSFYALRRTSAQTKVAALLAGTVRW
jgi:hypothetical protein